MAFDWNNLVGLQPIPLIQMWIIRMHFDFWFDRLNLYSLAVISVNHLFNLVMSKPFVLIAMSYTEPFNASDLILLLL